MPFQCIAVAISVLNSNDAEAQTRKARKLFGIHINDYLWKPGTSKVYVPLALCFVVI